MIRPANSALRGVARTALLAVFAASAAFGTAAGAEEPSRPPAASATERREAGLDRYREMIERPLFTPSRRSPGTGGDAPSDPDLPVLLGVVIAPERRLAILEAGDPAKALRAGVGARVGGYAVEKIEADRVMLRAASGRTEVVLLRPPAAPEAGEGRKIQSESTFYERGPAPAANAQGADPAISSVVSPRPRPGSSG